MSYSGWTNYETWNVALWIDNDQGSQEYWLDIAREAYRDAVATASITRSDRAHFVVADLLKDQLAEDNPLADKPGMFSDLLNAALSEVNYDEIASHWVDEVKEEIDAEELAEEKEESATS